MPWELSSRTSTASASFGSVKLGQPEPDSNLVVGVEQLGAAAAQRKTPSSWLFQYSPVKARSVPASRRTWYCSGVSSARHSASVFGDLGGHAS